MQAGFSAYQAFLWFPAKTINRSCHPPLSCTFTTLFDLRQSFLVARRACNTLNLFWLGLGHYRYSVVFHNELLSAESADLNKRLDQYHYCHTTMNVNKKLGRFKQWAGERMGGEVKTNVSDDFKSLEIEMGLRQEGNHIPPHGHEAHIDLLQAWNVSNDL